MIAAVLDACVLVPSVLADTLLRCAERELYRPLWSEEILSEVRRHLPTAHHGAADRRIAAMRRAFPEAMVDVLDGLAGCRLVRFAHRLGKDLPDHLDVRSRRPAAGS